MKKSSILTRIINKNYSHLNEEQKGITSILLVVYLVMLLVLGQWVIGCWFLDIPELVYLDSIGFWGYLFTFLAMFFFGFSYKWSRLILALLAHLVTFVPVIYYGIDSLFTLHLVIVPMSGILLFSRNEKSVFFQYALLSLILFLMVVFWNVYYDPIYQLSLEQNRIINIFIISGGMGVSFYYAFYYFNENNKHKDLIAFEREKSDRLLLSIFPETIVKQLRESNESLADSFDNVTVIFIDIVGFTKLSSSISPVKLVEILDDIFSSFDKIVDKYQVEKIKTIGDAYMAVCGLPNPDIKHCQKVADLALEITNLVKIKTYKGYDLKVRIGIHTGKVVAGVIGNRKFSYDLWGDTVNIASRFESTGEPDKIHITEVVKNKLGSAYIYEQHGEIEIKGKGMMKSFYLQGKRP